MSVIPAAAADCWQDLTAALAEHPHVPCRTSRDPDAWWQDAGDTGDRTQRALAGCQRCPARAACLAYALAADERFGVWGGTTPADRTRSTPCPNP